MMATGTLREENHLDIRRVLTTYVSERTEDLSVKKGDLVVVEGDESVSGKQHWLYARLVLSMKRGYIPVSFLSTPLRGVKNEMEAALLNLMLLKGLEGMKGKFAQTYDAEQDDYYYEYIYEDEINDDRRQKSSELNKKTNKEVDVFGSDDSFSSSSGESDYKCSEIVFDRKGEPAVDLRGKRNLARVVHDFRVLETGLSKLSVTANEFVSLAEDFNGQGEWIWVSRRQSPYEEGYVPKSYIQMLPGLDAQPWFLGKLGRQEVENLLLRPAIKDKTYLVKECDEIQDVYIICVRHMERVKYKKLVFSEGGFAIVDEVKFPSVVELIEYHTHCSAEELRLGIPYNKFTESDCSAPHQSEATADITKTTVYNDISNLEDRVIEELKSSTMHRPYRPFEQDFSTPGVKYDFGKQEEIHDFSKSGVKLTLHEMIQIQIDQLEAKEKSAGVLFTDQIPRLNEGFKRNLKIDPVKLENCPTKLCDSKRSCKQNMGTDLYEIQTLQQIDKYNRQTLSNDQVSNLRREAFTKQLSAQIILEPITESTCSTPSTAENLSSSGDHWSGERSAAALPRSRLGHSDHKLFSDKKQQFAHKTLARTEVPGTINLAEQRKKIDSILELQAQLTNAHETGRIFNISSSTNKKNNDSERQHANIKSSSSQWTNTYPHENCSLPHTSKDVQSAPQSFNFAPTLSQSKNKFNTTNENEFLSLAHDRNLGRVTDNTPGSKDLSNILTVNEAGGSFVKPESSDISTEVNDSIKFQKSKKTKSSNSTNEHRTSVHSDSNRGIYMPRVTADKHEEINLALAKSTQWHIKPQDITWIELIGSGMYGQVWKATWEGYRKEVAVKTFKTKYMNTEDFENEVISMKSLRHPNLVKLLGFNITGNQPFLVMEFHKYGSVLNYITKENETTLTEKQLVTIAFQVASGMAYLEERKYIHRDLAARNVLISNEFEAKIADFGLAKSLSGNERSEPQSNLKMPWKWTAPEALSSNPQWSAYCDVWSFGIFLWELFSKGEHPYAELKERHILMLFLEAGYRLQKPKDCKSWVYAGIITRCWERKPEDRITFRDIKGILNFRDELIKEPERTLK